MKMMLMVVLSAFLLMGTAVNAQEIVIGVATDTQILDGFNSIRGLKLAVEEINGMGGVNVAGK